VQRIYVTIRPLNREDSVLYFPPESFGPFRVLHQIGAGTLGPVFRAYEPAGKTRDRLVAVKVFRLDLTPEQSNALVAELNALVQADITHPNIAAPIAAGLEHGTAYLAQEYAVGESLDVVLRENGPMSIKDAVRLAESLAAAIDHAAGRGVHHGSLHLRDILMTEDGARITGFGIAAALSKVGAKRPTRPQYSLPDAPSDVYSLGAIAFEAVTGRRVSPDNLTDFEHLHGVELRGAFSVALAADPAMRPERAGDFVAVLRDAADMTAEAEMNTAAVGVPIPTAATPIAVTATPAADTDPEEDDSEFDLQIDSVIRASEIVMKPVNDAADRVIAPADPEIVSADRAIVPDDRMIPVESPTPLPSAWSTPPSRAWEPDLAVEEPPSRRWPMAAIFVVFAVLAVLSVGFLLRSRGPAATGTPESTVDETTVDLPGNAPPKPAPAPPAVKKDDRTPQTASTSSPPAIPSRPASGAVRRTQTGNLLVRSTPSEADIEVNGQPHGKTPLVLRDVALGSYTIRIAHEGYATEERTLQLTTRRPTFSSTISLRPAPASAAAEKSGPGGLTVQSRPAGARVYVNDQLAGSTPLTIPDVPAGAARVRIEMDGYQPWITTVRVNAGDQTKVSASLETQ
jgi:serine/threonine protein kinase